MKPATRKALTAGTTFSVALGIGFVMQYGDALAARMGVDDPIGGPDARTVTAPVVALASSSQTPERALNLPVDMASVAAVPVEVAAPQLNMPVADVAVFSFTDVVPDSGDPVDSATIMSEAPVLDQPDVADCASTLTATSQPLAMVGLTLTNSCYVDAPVTIHHQGMMFSAITDDTGLLHVTVPALTRDALFIADFKAGDGAAASVIVPELDEIDRAVLQWQGDDGVQLHALEFGADYDDAGHIWAASTGNVDLSRAGQGGFLTSLGNPAVSDALLVEVYTFPSGQSAKDGTVVLNVEAEVTSTNCGRDVAAQSIQVGPAQQINAVDLTMTMPSCDSIGEFLVLKNMFADLTLAAR